MTYTENQKSLINDFKKQFKYYFEGFELAGISKIYSGNLPVIKLGITSFNFSFETIHDVEHLNVEIILDRVGLLIGRMGKTINELTMYLKKYNINKITVKESDLWKRL